MAKERVALGAGATAGIGKAAATRIGKAVATGLAKVGHVLLLGASPTA